jgi:hypothetical protein
MAIKVKSGTDAMLYGLAAAHNTNWRDHVKENTSFPHADVTSSGDSGPDFRNPTTTALAGSAAAATSLALTITSANQSLKIAQLHFADALAHKAADTTNGTTLAVSALASTATQGATNTRLNLIKAACNLHVSQLGVHFTNDGTNTIATADASDLATSEALADAIQSFLTAHIAFAGTTQLLDVQAP